MNDVDEDCVHSVPNLETVTSQLCTASQFREPSYYRLACEFRQFPVLHRKQWEYVYILRALEQFGLLLPGVQGLGFGCGKEPLPAVMASRGATVTCTDIPPHEKGDVYWGSTDVEGFFYEGICDRERFREYVRFRAADMNAIPNDLRGFDFVWSSCALEHLGSLAHGARFVVNAMECLVPGGIAVHTTEYNLDDNEETLETEGLSLYRRRDMLKLVNELERAGHRVLPINYYPGSEPLDLYVDSPPYSRDRHLKLLIEGRFRLTSIGLIVRKKSTANPGLQ